MEENITGINPNIKYDFNQLKTGITAFITNLESKLQQFLVNLPVFMIETGDTSYYLNKKWEKLENKEIYEKTPRFTIKITDISPDNDELTNQYSRFIFKKDDNEYVADGRRLPYKIQIDTNFVSSNFIKMLENFEIMSTIIARQNCFTYDFMGNTFEAAYVFSSQSQETPSMDVGSISRNCIVKTPFELELHLLVPRVETIQLVNDAKLQQTQIDIVSDGIQDNMNINHNISEEDEDDD